jgi:hypothetical protein
MVPATRPRAGTDVGHECCGQKPGQYNCGTRGCHDADPGGVPLAARFLPVGRLPQRVLSMTLATERGHGEPARSCSGNVSMAVRAERLSGYKP